jgi:hypothetical protein
MSAIRQGTPFAKYTMRGIWHTMHYIHDECYLAHPVLNTGRVLFGTLCANYTMRGIWHTMR